MKLLLSNSNEHANEHLLTENLTNNSLVKQNETNVLISIEKNSIDNELELGQNARWSINGNPVAEENKSG